MQLDYRLGDGVKLTEVGLMASHHSFCMDENGWPDQTRYVEDLPQGLSTSDQGVDIDQEMKDQD